MLLALAQGPTRGLKQHPLHLRRNRKRHTDTPHSEPRLWCHSILARELIPQAEIQAWCLCLAQRWLRVLDRVLRMVVQRSQLWGTRRS